MAYIVKDERLIAPHRYTEATGAIADHETAEEELAVNERGAPQEAFRVLSKGDILYEDEADLNSVDEEVREEAAEAMMVKNKHYIADQERFGSLEKLESKSKKADSKKEKETAK